MGNLPYGPSPKDLINWAIICTEGSDPKIAAEETIISLTSQDPDIQEDVRRIINRIFG